uniref:carboxypeptidase-like regulatory domain-containing protein n=1 Tax=Flavobacterium sp. TaxID=239 RepID=UPI00404B53F0
MRYFVVFLFTLIKLSLFAQDNPKLEQIQGLVVEDHVFNPLYNAHVLNLNLVKGATTDEKGIFEIEAAVNDTLYISMIGFQSLKVKVTNDWVKAKQMPQIKLTEKSIALEEVVVTPYNLTGYLEIDAKLIPVRENYRYGISGLPYAYEVGNTSPNAFNRVMGAIFNPADMLYNVFGKKPKEMRKLQQLKKDNSTREMLESKFDRETIAVLLGIDKNDIPEILAKCNYSETFVKTANDLQILDAISDCYEEYKILKKRS